MPIAASTVINFEMVLAPWALVEISVIVNVPLVAYALVGFRVVDVAPSPKFHSHEVGVLVVWSTKLTDCEMLGEAGENANSATGAAPPGGGAVPPAPSKTY